MIKLKIYIDDEPVVKARAENLLPLDNIWKEFKKKIGNKERGYLNGRK